LTLKRAFLSYSQHRASSLIAQAQPHSFDQSSPFFYRAEQTSLLILDYHTLFVECASAHASAEKAIALKVWARSHNVSIAHALIDASDGVHPPPTVRGVERTEQLLLLLEAKAENWHEPAGLRPDSDDAESSEIVFSRMPVHISALTSRKPTDINEWLRGKGYKSLVFCGLSTDGRVPRTTDGATDAGFVMSVIEGACRDEPITHRIGLRSFHPGERMPFSLRHLLGCGRQGPEARNNSFMLKRNQLAETETINKVQCRIAAMDITLRLSMDFSSSSLCG